MGAGNGRNERRRRRRLKKRTGEKKELLGKERDRLSYSPSYIIQFLRILQNDTEHSSSLSPFISLSITPFLVPAVRSSVSLLISFPPSNIRFFPSYSLPA